MRQYFWKRWRKEKIQTVLEELKNNEEIGRVKHLIDGKPVVMYY